MLLKQVFEDSRVGLQWIVKRAWEFVRKLKISMKAAFLKAWREVREMASNRLFINLRLSVKGQQIIYSTTLSDALSDALEIIGELNKRLMYNISKRIYQDYEKFTGLLCVTSRFTFCQDVYIVEV